MTVAETLLVYAGAPLAVVVLLALLIFLPGGRSRARYRPGQPWEHEPVWYEPHPEHDEPGSGNETEAIGSSAYPERRAIGSGHGPQVTAHGSGTTGAGGHGGGHGDVSGDGAPVRGATALGARAGAPLLDAGPLGGARGTW